MATEERPSDDRERSGVPSGPVPDAQPQTVPDAGHAFDISSVDVRIPVAGDVIWATALGSLTAAFVICAPDVVSVGRAPSWRTRLARERIATVSPVEVDAHAEYGGWGIELLPEADVAGSARSLARQP